MKIEYSVFEFIASKKMTTVFGGHGMHFNFLVRGVSRSSHYLV
jgi:hypothetical protein